VLPPLVVGFGQLDRTSVAIICATVLGLHLFAFQVLYPKLLGKRLALNPLAVTLALLFWGSLWGPWGLILALPITAMMKIVFDHVERLRPFGDWLGE
jgi:predicted PurR-regulated permease PerM